MISKVPNDRMQWLGGGRVARAAQAAIGPREGDLTHPREAAGLDLD